MKTLLLLFFIAACSSNQTPLKKVDAVDVPRFMGRWYVIASIPTFIEKDATHGIENYTWNEKENRIDVSYTQIKDGEKKEYTQKAWVHNKAGSEWRIQIFWPFKFDYLIIGLAPDYSHTVVSVPDRDYVWIMSREKTMDENTYSQILDNLKSQNFEISKIKKVPQL